MIQHYHKPSRRNRRRTFRRANHPGFRLRWQSPDDLAAALTAFRRAIRAHRHLARLAPHDYDLAVVERDRLELAERVRWKALWAPVLEKAYGHPTPAQREARQHTDWLTRQPPRLAPATRRAVDRHLVDWKFWLIAGRLAWNRHRRLRPHERISLGRVARMLDIACDLGRLATGLDSTQPAYDPANYDAALADLKRAYGHKCPPSAPATTENPPVPPVAVYTNPCDWNGAPNSDSACSRSGEVVDEQCVP